ncbi:dorsalin-1-like [Physella acuta]|uniref:dorsalin-1-like n=1 Tax=Physella acuta TaxID=109671 RepID=UPI0027DDF6F8|nr:dorsalin-1-like [Physella acuta]
MRNVLFVFRVLLPPLIFVNISMSRPSGQQSVRDYSTNFTWDAIPISQTLDSNTLHFNSVHGTSIPKSRESISKLNKLLKPFETNNDKEKVENHRELKTRSRIRRSNNETKLWMGYKLRSPSAVPPEYMLHLYQLLEGTNYQLLQDTVVLSFVNIHDGGEDSVQEAPYKQSLVFNVSLDVSEQVIQYAELRLFFVVRNNNSSKDQVTAHGHNQVSISEVLVEGSPRVQLITTKNISNTNATWESFNITSAVQAWRVSGPRVLEVTIDNVNASDNNVAEVFLENVDGKEPLLVVFSKKHSRRKSAHHSLEKRDASNEQRGPLEEVVFLQNPNVTSAATNASLYFQGLLNAVASMQTYDDGLSSPEAAEDDISDNENQLFHDLEEFDDMTTDEFSILNLTFQNQELLTELASRKKKLQSLQNLADSSGFGSDPLMADDGSERPSDNVKARQFVSGESFTSKLPSSNDDADDENIDELKVRNVRRETKKRYRRHLDSLFQGLDGRVHPRYRRSKKKRNFCRREEMLVDFQSIKYDMVIIYPISYQAYECVGRCFYPIGQYLTPTKHAIIQTLMHTTNPKFARACCVPTKLEPISVLYSKGDGVIEYDYTFEDMVVAECGCR